MKNREVYLINWHNYGEVAYGPSQIFNIISKEMDKYAYINIISSETFQGDFKTAMTHLLKIMFRKGRKTFLVNMEGLKLPFILLFLSRIFRGNKYFLLCHGLRKTEDVYADIYKPNYYRLEKFLLKTFPDVIYVSNLLKTMIEKECGRKKKGYVIYNGLQHMTSTNFNVTEGKIKSLEKGNIELVHSGGVKNIKGIVETIELVKAINNKDKSYKVRLKIFGVHDKECTLEYVKEAAENCDYVEYYGSVEKEELYKAYERAHFNICLSKQDSFNMTVLEAMMKGCPSICSDRVGAAELLTENTGIVVREKKLQEIEKFFDEIFENPKKYSIMVKECALISKKYTIEKMVQQYKHLFL